MFVSRESDGSLTKVPIPLSYAYMVAAAAIVGIFTVTGLAGSYSRMLIKTARFNQLRQDHNNLQRDYAPPRALRPRARRPGGQPRHPRYRGLRALRHDR